MGSENKDIDVRPAVLDAINYLRDVVSGTAPADPARIQAAMKLLDLTGYIPYKREE